MTEHYGWKPQALMLLWTAFVVLSFIPMTVQAVLPSQWDPNNSWQHLYPVVNDFLQTVRAGDEEKAYNSFTTKDFQKKTSLEEFKKFISEARTLHENKIFKFLSFYFDDGIAIFQGSLVSSKGDSLQTEFDLKMEGNAWKIDGIHLFKPQLISPPQENPYTQRDLDVAEFPLQRKL